MWEGAESSECRNNRGFFVVKCTETSKVLFFLVWFGIIVTHACGWRARPPLVVCVTCGITAVFLLVSSSRIH